MNIAVLLVLFYFLGNNGCNCNMGKKECCSSEEKNKPFCNTRPFPKEMNGPREECGCGGNRDVRMPFPPVPGTCGCEMNS